MAIAFSHFGSNAATSGSVAATVTINAGDTVVVLIMCDASNARTVSTVVDSSGTNTYAQKVNLTNSNSCQAFLWGSLNVGSSATSVTVTMSGTYLNLDVVVLTYTGVGTNGFGSTNTASGAAAGSQTVTLTTQDANNFIVGGFMGHNTTGTWTFSIAGGNLRTQKAATNGSNFDGVGGVDELIVSAGLGTIGTTSSRNLTWVGLVAELRSTNISSGAADLRTLMGVGT